jgi:hypothetical protein
MFARNARSQVTFTGFAAPQIVEFSNEPARQLMAALHDCIGRPRYESSGRGIIGDRAPSHSSAAVLVMRREPRSNVK